MKVKISDKTKKMIFIVIGVLVVAFIFFNSFQNAEKSSGASDLVASILGKIFGSDLKNKINLIRKLAHFCEYALLGAALGIVKGKVKKLTTEGVVLIGLICALCDETIQLFSEGRSGQVSDIWIDFCGFLCGLGVYFLIKWIKNKKLRSILKENSV